jgi:hypothetical protein
MAFQKKTAEGEYDPKINLNGRPKGDGKKLTNREVREREFLSLLRKLKPLVAQSISTACKIMGNEEASHQNRLKAATIILAEYKSALENTYNENYDEAEAEEVQPAGKGAVFSLKMISNNDEIKKE